MAQRTVRIEVELTASNARRLLRVAREDDLSPEMVVAELIAWALEQHWRPLQIPEGAVAQPQGIQ